MPKYGGDGFPQCDGDCSEHKGAVEFVHVRDPKNGHDWGTFYYCNEAIKTDRKAGLRVRCLTEGGGGSDRI